MIPPMLCCCVRHQEIKQLLAKQTNKQCSHHVGQPFKIKLVCGGVLHFRGNHLETTFCDGRMEFSTVRRGEKNGFFIVVDSTENPLGVGKYRRGIRYGAWWRRLEGSAWVIGRGEEQSRVFLYPDLVTALVGNFNDEGLGTSELTVGEVVGVSSAFGILTPVLRSRGTVLPEPRASASDTLISQPYVPDPYEHLYVEARESLIPGAGEGLFTRQGCSTGQLLAYFAGVQMELKNGEERSEYSISMKDGTFLDIPEHLRSTFCGTLGHKACHSFQPSAVYSYAVHPRFGLIRSVVALHSLQAGEEVTTDYRYSLKKAPDWYKRSLVSFLVSYQGVSTKQAETQIKDIMESSSVPEEA